MSKWRVFVGLVIIVAAQGRPAAATSIASGQTLYGEITRIGQIDAWSFWGEAGVHATIVMSKGAGEFGFNPCLELQAPDGTVLTTVADAHSVMIDSYDLPQTGTYYLLCRDWFSTYTCVYGLSLQENPGTTSPPDVDGGPITSGEWRAGEIDLADLDTFTLTASAGDHATIFMVNYDYEFYTCLELQAPDGTVIGSNAGNPSAMLDSVDLPQDGTYYLICRDGYGINSGGYNLTVMVMPHDPPSPPTADFSATPTSGSAPLPVDFTDLSTGSPTSWLWNFGDGETSTDQNPSHTYLAADSYTVSLTAGNAGGSDTESKPDYVVLLGPTAGFSATPTTGTEPLGVAFTDTSAGAPTDWMWSFGDGGTSTAQNPGHTYNSPGCFTVSLTASNAGGADTETQGSYITVYPLLPDPPEAAFTGAPTLGLAPLWVTFSDASTGDPNGWLWSFGDSTASTLQNPSHQYTVPGRYTVSLAASNPGGSDVATRPTYITVSFPDVPLDFWAMYQILACVEAGVVSGYPDGTYRPDLPVTRDAMAVYISRAVAGGDASVLPGPVTATFGDVPTNHWAYKYVEYAHAQNVVDGYWDGTYRPTLEVSRAQMAVFVARSMVAPAGDAGIPPGPVTATFPDVPTDHWAYKQVEYCHGQGVVSGYWDGTYRPEEVVNRGAMAVFVVRAFELPM